MITEPSDAALNNEVQGLALTGYSALCMRTLMLTATSAVLARRFVASLLNAQLLAFGSSERIGKGLKCTINIGFTYEGLRALGAPERILAVLKNKSLAFAEGAALRAARYLGDAGESAVERWDRAFEAKRAHVWISIHGAGETEIEYAVKKLRELPGAADGLSGWERPDAVPDGKHIRDLHDAKINKVHFGFRDSLTKPSILGKDGKIGKVETDGKVKTDGNAYRPRTGELLLGYPNNDGADLWTADPMPDDIASFLRNGSFGILRKIEQYEERFDDYLQKQVDRLTAQGYAFVTKDFLKAKMCGRWPNGAPVLPRETEAPPAPSPARIEQIDFQNDSQGLGCPFGAHIRRSNPRTDPLMPKRDRTLFRRGIPYGPPYDAAQATSTKDERGLLGVFFCARIEDQFEHLISEWVEKNPMGPPNPGRAKDPLVGRNDEPASEFHIPLPGGRIALSGLQPFVRTRGTLYALFPSRQALEMMGTGKYWNDKATAQDAQATAKAGASVNGAAPAAADDGDAADDDANAKDDEEGKDHAAADGEDDEEDEDGIGAMDAPSDRFCDVVMEGGITSGIIYASSVVELARHYRFRSIGGSSIGAFGAALTAAAEYRRRHGYGDGFEKLAKLPDELAKEEDGRTRLERCFVPQRSTRRLFRVFLATLDRSGPVACVLFGLQAALRQYLWLIVVSTLVLAAIVLAGPIQTAQHCWGGPPLSQCTWPLVSWGTAALLTLFVSVGGALFVGVCWDFARGVVPNGFGLCRGWDPEAPVDSPDLAAFLHLSIQRVAGRDPRDAPLTFRDLWNAPGSAAQALGYEARGAAARSINLEVYASNLSHGRPYRFPLDEAEDMGRLFFRVDELERYFPKGIVQYLAAFSPPYKARSKADPPAQIVPDGYLELPVADMPIVVAARLAMSFPLLISAVPLHGVNHQAQCIDPCWMSDGGLCSNFPIHLFDSFLPMWPTFGISLNSRDEGDVRRVWLPEFHTSGRSDTWDHGPDKSFWKLGGFLMSLWNTTWRWNDSTMMRMPGVRDRVVRIYLSRGEGGVNIRMRGAKIKKLSNNYGTPAAKAFIEKFQAPGSRGWQEHRWVRLNCLMISLRERIRNFDKAVDMDRHTEPLDHQLLQAESDAPLHKPERRSRFWPSEKALDAEQVEELQALVQALRRLQLAFEQAGEHDPFQAIPRSSLRIRHPT